MRMHAHKPDISVIVTAHCEGRLAHHTLQSIFRAMHHAEQHDMRIEVIAVLDNADKSTEEYFRKYRNPYVQINSTEFGDPGLARNQGVILSSGKYVAFLDADDLFGKMWLTAAFQEAERIRDTCVLHPEYVVCFGTQNMIAKPKSVFDKDFNPKNLIQYNYWNSVHFLAPRSLLLDVPFAPTPEGFGYEDWHWHCEIVSRHIPIRTVPETVVFYRKKAHASRLTKHDNQRVLVPPTRLFDPDTFTKVAETYPLKI